MSYPGRGYSLPEARAFVNDLNQVAARNAWFNTDVLKTEFVFSLSESGLSIRHIHASWVVTDLPTSTPLYQFLMQELDERLWDLLGDWISSWINDGFDLVEEASVIHFRIQGC